MNPSKRRKARRYAVQGVYQWQLTGNDTKGIYERIMEDVNVNKTDLEYFEELVTKVPEHQEQFIELLSPEISRKIDEIDPVECAILRIAIYELATHAEIPYRVVINEAIEQAKTFGAEDGHKFVNGALDKVALKIREVEVKGNKKG